MNSPTVPTDEEMHQQFHDEVHRTMEVLWKPLSEALDEHHIGEKLPPRIAAAVVCHALSLLGISVATHRKLPVEAILDVLHMVEQTLKKEKSDGD